MQLQYDFDSLMKTDCEDACDDKFQHCNSSVEDGIDSGDDESIDMDFMDKRDSPKSLDDDLDGHESLDDQLFDAELQCHEKEHDYEDKFLVKEAQRVGEEMRRRAEQERLQRERAELMRQMRANYQNATDSFSFYEEEEEDEEEEEFSWGFDWRAVKRDWLSHMPETVTPPSNLRIFRTCVTEPGVVELLVDFQRAEITV